jgi:hypothetical protein
MKSNRIVVILNTQQRVALDKIKKESGTPIAFLIRKAIDKFLEVKK